MSLKICAISDTHNKHQQISIEPCGILIHAGDESMMGSKKEIQDFMAWFEKQPAKHLIWTPGNHSVMFEKHYPGSLAWVKEASPRTNILVNQEVILEGIKIYGSPVTPFFQDWAYNEWRGPNIKKFWDLIPDDTDILVTHGPPFGILDVVEPNTHREQRVGCEDLGTRCRNIPSLKYHLFGHIHESYGTETRSGVTYINAAICDELYCVTNQPVLFDYP